MPFHLIALIGLTLVNLFQLFISILNYRSAENPTPENVKDLYDQETYRRWKQYNHEKCRLAILSTLVSFLVAFALLLLNVYSLVCNALATASDTLATLIVLIVYHLAQTLFMLPLEYYDTFAIEEKFGFNRSSRKTFLLDQVKNFILSLLLIFGLTWLFQALHQGMGDGVLILFAVLAFVILMGINFLYPFIARLFNKFTPLEEGELKDKLTGLLEKHGYKVRAIQVMDASRRSTKSNAYFTGFGKMKTIVLYDTLLQKMEPDEICAVFAHELGHGLHRDVQKSQVLSLFSIALMGVGLWLLARTEALYPAFGFSAVNYGLAMLLLSDVVMGLLSPLMNLFTCWHSRKAEYRADATAVKEGYGPALISGLKKISKDNFANLAPSPLVVKLTYSHPPLSQRIAAIEQAMEE
ncbi:MAG: M48 family metallopeptidase [Clostridiales bacterium]|nr:M48 family metallopeptidase [Clostridiales bacterium]